MSPRSTLRLRQVKHTDPARGTEPIIEVLRDGKVVATIYGSREGVHIISDRLAAESPNSAFFFQVGDLPPGYVVALLDSGETCPWCEGARTVQIPPGSIRICPVCQQGMDRI